MHDAMQTYWSHFANAPKWSMWVFSAALHDMGRSLGGIMFDDIGPNHRQGTAIFTEAFISVAPGGDQHRTPGFSECGSGQPRTRWVTRSISPIPGRSRSARTWDPWIPLMDEPEARSFMNYPYNVAGGETAFFANFEYRFSNAELLFMRHAPARFVQMGNARLVRRSRLRIPGCRAAGMRSTGSRCAPTGNARSSSSSSRSILEVKLTNTGRDPKLIGTTTLTPQSLVVIIKPEGKPARQWIPYASDVRRTAEQKVLDAGAVCVRVAAAVRRAERVGRRGAGRLRYPSRRRGRWRDRLQRPAPSPRRRASQTSRRSRSQPTSSPRMSVGALAFSGIRRAHQGERHAA